MSENLGHIRPRVSYGHHNHLKLRIFIRLRTTHGFTRLPCGTPEPASVIEAHPGDDGQTPSGNRQVINGQEQREEEKSGKF